MSHPVPACLDRLGCIFLATVVATLSCTPTRPPAAEQPPIDVSASVAELSVVTSAVDLIRTYADSSNYVVFDIDINMDGNLDKVVSSARNKGDEMIFFLRDQSGFREVLKTSNLSEDGGRMFEGIDPIATDHARSEVFTIKSASDKGQDVAEHYISYSDGGWTLSRTVYTVSDWREVGMRGYRCEVTQGIPMQDLALEGVRERVQKLPEADDRDDLCEAR